MTHSHGHHVHRHTPRAGFSLLRSSVAVRLGIVGASAAVLWAAVFWAST